MKLLRARLVMSLGCVLIAYGAQSQQGRGPGGPPPAPRGGPGGMGGPAGPGGPPPNSNSSAAQPNTTSSGAAAARGGLSFGPPGRWWDDRSVTSSIGLRPTQQKQMDAIFDANKSAIVSSYTTLMTQQSKLDTLNKQTNVDSKALFAVIDSVNQARASLQKATSEMLLQIRNTMDAEQVAKLQKLH